MIIGWGIAIKVVVRDIVTKKKKNTKRNGIYTIGRICLVCSLVSRLREIFEITQGKMLIASLETRSIG